ncbi:ubiquitin-like modifier-activating enzyme 1 [Anguilla anguilla]|uniref:ubiquitin-like modifier-activating enzyme 1 n=1 Tax=Anguilla anguilla TaxID=7936 RepID=UPI0015AC2F25|nr:ubiquitin-like modifier-activating enzyme 1 [Anguilla anguilla]XP_035239383.1 ubiquitin-like modifier-activating enzyme 1 [Anguilla anguilla]
MSRNADIDEGLYSRQLYVLGHEAMHRLKTADILIAGMRGLGVEIAKNIILAGVKSVTIQDEGLTQWPDLSSQFYLGESDVGQNRAECSLPHLCQLNAYVKVSAYTGPLTEDFLAQFQVVVLTDSSLDEQCRFGDFCHSNEIKFIVADTKGLCGQLFCDFGKEFEVMDANGEPPISAMIAHISKGNPGIVTCTDEGRHGFEDGGYVTFSDIRGMTELNSCGPVKVKVLGTYSFSIGDTSAFSEYKRGGVATEVKRSMKFTFEPLRKSKMHPKMVMTDYGKPEKHETLHWAFQALHAFVKTNQRLPKARAQTDAETLLSMVRQLKEEAQLQQLDEDLVRKLSFTARGDLAPVNAFIGGLAAQEVMKACSRKFTPLQQWLYFDALECLPEEDEQAQVLTEEACEPRDSRYDGQIAVFGKAFQEKLAMQKYFLVGAGAIGCELLKNFALIGLGAGEGGHITVTDMDSIERSNLNRQFLFRPQDIGMLKSEVAARATVGINPSMQITAHQNRVDPGSEVVYGHQFFSDLDGVAAALDNVEARVYLDGRCVMHQKPMLEGGTLGSKGHTLVVVPFLTESYGPAKSGSEKEIPLCTLKNFPYRIEHTLQWARDQFEGLFKQQAENVNQYLDDDGFLQRTLERGEAEALEILQGLCQSIEDQRPGGWEDCVGWARRKWETLYNNDIRQLLHCFPSDQMTSSGLPFWSGQKRCPHPLTFDPNNTTHMDYIVAAANLYAQIYGIEGTRDHTAIGKALQQVQIPNFTPRSGVKIHTTDQEMENDKGDVDEDLLECLKGRLSSRPEQKNSFRMHPAEFEKDDDTNFHMDFIVAASNLRAENYDIPPADWHKSKLIAGRIIPAIATTTAAVAGLMCLELYKVVQGHRNIRSFRSAYINMAAQHYVMSEPFRAPTYYVAGKKYSLWDDFPVQGMSASQKEMTLRELFAHIKREHNLEITHLFYGPAMLYYNGANVERLEQSVSDVVRTVTKTEIPAHQQVLEFTASFAEDEEDSETAPPIRYRFR